MYARSADAVQPFRRLVVGRNRELTAVYDALDAARRGTAGAVCIEGVPGMGRTTVLDAAVARAADLGFIPLAARASVAERDVPFGVFRQLFEQVPPSVLPGVLPPGVPPPGEWTSAPLESGKWSIHPEGLADEAAVLHALHRLAANLTARAPLLLAVDDVDQTDPPSLRWLAYLQRRMHRMPAVLAMTLGLGGRATDRALLVEVVAAARRLALRPLTVDDCAQLVRAALAPHVVADGFVAACHAVTDGNPFVLEELLQALRDDGVTPDARAVGRVRRCRPPWLADRLLSRLRAHDPALATLTRAVAVLGSPDPEVAAAAAGLPLPVAAEAAQSLVSMGILELGPRLELRSSVAQASVAQDVSPVERDAIHARAAELLWAERAAPERIAAHLLETTSVRGEWVAETLCTVGRQAIADGAPDLALACLRRALREPLPDESRDELLQALGMAEVFSHPRAAIEHLGAVRGDCGAARRLLAIARSYAASARGESAARAVELATRAWRERVPSADGDDLRAASELCCTVLTLVFADRLDEARECCAQLDGEREAPLVAEVAATLTAMISYRSGQLAVALTAARDSMRALSRLGAARWMAAAIALPVLIEAAVERDELTIAREAVEYAGLSGDLPECWRYHYLLGCRGRLRAATGDLRAALEDHLEAGRRLREIGVLNPAVVSWRSYAALLSARLGRPDQAAELAAENLTLARRWGAPRTLGIALRTAGTVSRDQRGRALLAEAVAALQESGARLELAHALAELGASQGRAGRTEECAATLQRARDLAQRCGGVALQARIEDDLRALPAGRLPGAPCELTPHELRIATMAVSGLTNREIASTLRVTSRAVELHLTKLYRKLGIARRSQLGTALTLHGY